MENIYDTEKLKQELEAEKVKLQFAIQKDIPFEEAKPIRQRISQLQKLIAQKIKEKEQSAANK